MRILALALSLVFALAPTPTLSARLLEGQWKGYAFHYPHIVELALEVQAGKSGALSGKLETAPLTRTAVASGMRREPDRYTLQIKWDEDSRSFEFRPEIDEGADNALAPMLGVLAEDAHRLAGFWSAGRAASSPYFILARPEDLDARLAPLVEKLVLEKPDSARPLFSAAAASRLGQWVARLNQEYPKPLDEEASPGELYLRARNLFQDAHFKSFFGQTYDEMSAEARLKVSLNLQSDDRLEAYRYLASSFSPTGPYAQSDIFVSVLSMRVINAWANERRKQLRSLRAAPSTPDTLDGLDDALRTRLALSWPSEAQASREIAEQARRRLAEPYLDRGLRLVFSQAKGLEGVEAIEAWSERNAEILVELTDSERAGFDYKINNRINDLLKDELRPKLARVLALGSGREALVEGNRWLSALVDRYRAQMLRPPVEAAIRILLRRRPGDIGSASSFLSSQIEAQVNWEGIDRLLAYHLGVPGDAMTAEGRALRMKAWERKREIDTDRFLSYYSAREKGLMVEAGRISAPKAYTEPYAAEAQLALLREVEALGGHMRSAEDAYFSLPLLDRFGEFFELRIQKLDIIAVRPLAMGQGFRCRYVIRYDLTLSAEGRVLLESVPALADVNDWFRSVGGRKAATLEDRFELTSSGWRSATARERGLRDLLSP